MQTVFDIATPQELVFLFDDGVNPCDEAYIQKEKERLQKKVNDNDTFGLLSLLYAHRGDMKRADECLAKMPDAEMRLDYQLFIYEEVD